MSLRFDHLDIAVCIDGVAIQGLDGVSNDRKLALCARIRELDHGQEPLTILVDTIGSDDVEYEDLRQLLDELERDGLTIAAAWLADQYRDVLDAAGIDRFMDEFA